MLLTINSNIGYKNKMRSCCMLLAPLKASKPLTASGCDARRQPKSSASQPVPGMKCPVIPCSPPPMPLIFPHSCLQPPSPLTSVISALPRSFPPLNKAEWSEWKQSCSPFFHSFPCYCHLSAPVEGLPHLLFLAKNTTFSVFSLLWFYNSPTCCIGACLFWQFWAWGLHPLYLLFFPPLPLMDVYFYTWIYPRLPWRLYQSFKIFLSPSFEFSEFHNKRLPRRVFPF